jgi:hypothetical protein
MHTCYYQAFMTLCFAQVRVADALYILLGVTPDNEGEEVYCLLKSWEEKKLHISDQLVAEMNFVGECLPDFVRFKKDQRPSPSSYQHKRQEITAPLTAADKQEVNVYDYMDWENPPLPLRGTVSKELKHGRDGQLSDQPCTAAEHFDARQHIPAMDHHRALKIDQDPQVSWIDDVPGDFFTRKSSDEEGNDSQQLQVQYIRRQVSLMSGEPRTISARDLVEITDRGFPRGVAVVKITPGLHPVLRSPPVDDDFCAIPHEQQRSLRKKADSLEKSHGMAQSKITAIFSNNGATWDHLNNLPPYSTLIGREFYLRKSHERGAWVLLMGASTKDLLDKPPYFLWSVLDTVKLSALDYHHKVLCFCFSGITSD